LPAPSPAPAPAPSPGGGGGTPKKKTSHIQPPRTLGVPPGSSMSAPADLPDALPISSPTTRRFDRRDSEFDSDVMQAQVVAPSATGPAAKPAGLAPVATRTQTGGVPEKTSDNQSANASGQANNAGQNQTPLAPVVHRTVAANDPVSAAWLAQRLGLPNSGVTGAPNATVPITINQFAAPVKNATPASGADDHRWFHRRKRDSNVKVRSTTASGIGVPASLAGIAVPNATVPAQSPAPTTTPTVTTTP
jgi:hypothetical protein